jgi:hypothetical protein
MVLGDVFTRSVKMRDAQEQVAAPQPQPQIQFTPLHMMTTNIWQATHMLGANIDFASFAVIEQLMLEYEATIKNLVMLAIMGNETAYNAVKVQLQTHIRDRETLILTMSSTILQQRLAQAAQAKKESALAPSDESAASAPSAPVASTEGGDANAVQEQSSSA